MAEIAYRRIAVASRMRARGLCRLERRRISPMKWTEAEYQFTIP